MTLAAHSNHNFSISENTLTTPIKLKSKGVLI